MASSNDAGRSFSTPVQVTKEKLNLDWGPDARPQIVVEKNGGIALAFSLFRDKAFNGQVLATKSADGGKSFAEPKPITSNNESQRFVALGLDADGSVFSAWIDKRNRVPAKQERQEVRGGRVVLRVVERRWRYLYRGADGKRQHLRVLPARTCIRRPRPSRGRVQEHLRGRCPGSRGHDVRRSGDAGRGSPRQQGRLADCRVPASWAKPFDLGRRRLSRDLVHQRQGAQGAVLCPLAGRGPYFSEPLAIGRADRNPTRPYVLAGPRGTTMVWKEFDGEKTTVNAMTSHDDGKSWSKPVAIATTVDTSDHPLLVSDGHKTFLSWMTKADGYRLLAIGDES